MRELTVEETQVVSGGNIAISTHNIDFASPEIYIPINLAVAISVFRSATATIAELNADGKPTSAAQKIKLRIATA
jgi:hypothetical protein